MNQNEYFTDQEVADIVRRAAQIEEETQGSESGRGLGVSRSELARAAGEIGISYESIDRAIAERVHAPARKISSPIGPKSAYEIEKIVEGELPIDDFDLVLEAIGHKHRRLVRPLVGKSMEAYIEKGLAQARLTVTSRDGRTRIHAQTTAIGACVVSFMPASGVLFILLILNIGTSTGTQLGMNFLVAATVLMALAWAAFQIVASSCRQTVSDMVDAIAQRVAERNR